jgi:hypothetical protein
MLGLVVLAAAGIVAWKYRDSLSQYVKGNAGPAKEKLDRLLSAAQQKSDTLLEQAKGTIASRLEGGREKLNTGVSRKKEGETPAE